MSYDLDRFKYKYKHKEEEKKTREYTKEPVASVSLQEECEDTLNNDTIDDYEVDDSIETISDIDQLALIIKLILELAWGTEWGEMIPSFIEDEENPIFPKIVYDINTRELSEYRSKKPIYFENIKEVVNGKETGDGFNIYRQWYDTVVEFNFYARTIKEARELMHNFEKVINTYIGLIKKKGLSEMFYLEEIPSEKSMKYKPGVPMKSNAYYVRFESIYKVRTSLLKEIEYIINAK